MAIHALGKINSRLKFLYRNQSFLNSSLRRLLCNAIIQPHYDFACLAWYPNLNKGLKKKVQTSQNKCIRFCLNMGNRDHVGVKEFKKINWLPTKERFEQCITKLPPDIYQKCITQLGWARKLVEHLKIPNQVTYRGLRTLTYVGPRLWNNLTSNIKSSGSVNIFKHMLKVKLFRELQKEEDSPYVFY